MRTDYIELLNHKVEIPIIQRDYAQGRIDGKTSKIRKDFLDALFEIIYKKSKDPDEEIELDFIYGFYERNEKQEKFIPIDGQQRLTSLWLLYWFVAAKERIPEEEKNFLSNFVYEIRHSTTQFCKELIGTKIEPDFSEATISSKIKNQSWYFETWDYDPTIQAILVVLDDMEQRYALLNNNSVWKLIASGNCPFYFYKLDMKRVGLTDDLYIKMNSRGKALTEFEYFKAGFSGLIIDSTLKKRFEESIDGKWIDAIWHIVFESGLVKQDDDIAWKVDDAFLNLFNFLTSVLSFKKEIKTINGERYSDTVRSAALLEQIYCDSINIKFLFDTLDAICSQQEDNSTFWDSVFYYGKNGFTTQSVRLFFTHGEPNLLKRCLFYYSDSRGLTFPEQLLLNACFTHFKSPQHEFSKRIRTIRNLVVNSDNELRESILGYGFDEVENFILNGDLAVFKNFKTDQIEEEKQKVLFLQQAPIETDILYQLEDSEILRGSTSLFPLDHAFGNRAKQFLKFFDEDEFSYDFREKSNLLLCFGDYTQTDGSLTNLMSGNKTRIRNFLTTPGYNKTAFNSKTRLVLMECLDFFINNPTATAQQHLSDTLIDYTTKPKDWKYYFIKYNSFRDECEYGYYQWEDEQYCIWKMRKKQSNGFHWDPFLYEIFNSTEANNFSLKNYDRAKLMVTFAGQNIWISTISDGFFFEDATGNRTSNFLLDNLINNEIINHDAKLIVPQDSEGLDLQDRIELLKQTLGKLSEKNEIDDSILFHKEML